MYDDLEPADSALSCGTIQLGGDEIDGEWTIPGDWSGTFLMIRQGERGRMEELERRRGDAGRPRSRSRISGRIQIVSPRSSNGSSPLSPRASAMNWLLSGPTRWTTPIPNRRIAEAARPGTP